jgi:hypothetical protein
MRQMQQKRRGRICAMYVGNGGNEKEEEGSLVKGGKKRKRKKVLETEVKIEGRGRRFG